MSQHGLWLFESSLSIDADDWQKLRDLCDRVNREIDTLILPSSATVSILSPKGSNLERWENEGGSVR